MKSHAFLAAACAAALSSAAHAQTLTYVDSWSVRTGWDMASDDAYLGIRAGCYEGLTKVDFDGQVKPLLATSWTQSSPTAWDFKIREGVKFQDGTPMTPDAVANSLNQLLKAPVPTRAFSSKLVKSVDVVDGGIVRITTLEPTVLLPGQIASPAVTILAPSAYKDGKVNPINACTGPFAITRVDPTQGMTLKRNDAYWGDKPALAGAEVKFIIDSNGRATQIRTGETDVSRLIPTTTLKQLKALPNVKLAEVQAPRTLMMLLNNKKAPLDDVRVRQAIQAAIDNSAIAAAVFEGAVPPAMGPFRVSDPWAPKDQKPAYDLAKAKKLLEEAGIKPGTLKLRLWGYTSKPELKDVGAVIQEMLGQVGIGVELRMAEYNAIEPDMLAGNFDMAFMSRGYLTDVPEPIGFFNADYGCSGSFNMAHYCTPEMDAELKKIFAMSNQPDRFDAYRKLAAKVQAEAINIFIVHENLYDAYSAKVKNYRAHPVNYYIMTPQLGVN
ncbi:ABC transporter substrate-binding protein [Terrarubrum flagellatum]|uniref:ABC transporter substrate-binding protein n=1 Tax=Terrirubrum flagellatum TaxID=2895980 RepID=UPI0031456923